MLLRCNQSASGDAAASESQEATRATVPQDLLSSRGRSPTVRLHVSTVIHSFSAIRKRPRYVDQRVIMAEPSGEAPAQANDDSKQEDKPARECPICVMMRRGGCEPPFKVRLGTRNSSAAHRDSARCSSRMHTNSAQLRAPMQPSECQRLYYPVRGPRTGSAL